MAAFEPPGWHWTKRSLLPIALIKIEHSSPNGTRRLIPIDRLEK
jgi:hypothetical protein